MNIFHLANEVKVAPKNGTKKSYEGEKNQILFYNLLLLLMMMLMMMMLMMTIMVTIIDDDYDYCDEYYKMTIMATMIMMTFRNKHLQF
jgi:hypothetical protein